MKTDKASNNNNNKKKKKRVRVVVISACMPLLFIIFTIVIVTQLPKYLWDKAWTAFSDFASEIRQSITNIGYWITGNNYYEKVGLSEIRLCDAESFDQMYAFDLYHVLNANGTKDSELLTTYKKQIENAFIGQYLGIETVKHILENMDNAIDDCSKEDFVATHIVCSTDVTLTLTPEEYVKIIWIGDRFLRSIPQFEQIYEEWDQGYGITSYYIIYDTDGDGVFTFDGADRIEAGAKEAYPGLDILRKEIQSSVICGKTENGTDFIRIDIRPYIAAMRAMTGSVGPIQEKGEQLSVVLGWWARYSSFFQFSPVVSYAEKELSENGYTLLQDAVSGPYLQTEDWTDEYGYKKAYVSENKLEVTGSYIPNDDQNFLSFKTENDKDYTATYILADASVTSKDGKFKEYTTFSYLDETKENGVDWQIIYALLTVYAQNGSGNTAGMSTEQIINAANQTTQAASQEKGRYKIRTSIMDNLIDLVKSNETFKTASDTYIGQINQLLRDKGLYEAEDIREKKGKLSKSDISTVSHFEYDEVVMDEENGRISVTSFVPTYVTLSYESLLCSLTYNRYENATSINSYEIEYTWSRFAQEVKTLIGLDIEDSWKDFERVLLSVPGGERILQKLEHVKENDGKKETITLEDPIYFGTSHASSGILSGGTPAKLEWSSLENGELPYPLNSELNTCKLGEYVKNGIPELNNSNFKDFWCFSLSKEEKDTILEKLEETYGQQINLNKGTIGRSIIATALDAVGNVAYRNDHRSKEIEYVKDIYADQWVTDATSSELFPTTADYMDYYTRYISKNGLFPYLYEGIGFPLKLVFPTCKKANATKRLYGTKTETDEDGNETVVYYPYTEEEQEESQCMVATDCSGFVNNLYELAIIAATCGDPKVTPNSLVRTNGGTGGYLGTNSMKTFMKKIVVSDNEKQTNISIFFDENKKVSSATMEEFCKNGFAREDAEAFNLLPGDYILTRKTNQKTQETSGHVRMFLGWTTIPYVDANGQQQSEWAMIIVDCRGYMNYDSCEELRGSVAYGVLSARALVQQDPDWKLDVYAGRLMYQYTPLGAGGFQTGPEVTIPLLSLHYADTFTAEWEQWFEKNYGNGGSKD